MRERRQALGRSQYDIAHLSGIDVANYGRLERGAGNPTLATIIQVSVALDSDPATLLSGLGTSAMLPAGRRAYSVTDFLAQQQQLD